MSLFVLLLLVFPVVQPQTLCDRCTIPSPTSQTTPCNEPAVTNGIQGNLCGCNTYNQFGLPLLEQCVSNVCIPHVVNVTGGTCHTIGVGLNNIFTLTQCSCTFGCETGFFSSGYIQCSRINVYVDFVAVPGVFEFPFNADIYECLTDDFTKCVPCSSTCPPTSGTNGLYGAQCLTYTDRVCGPCQAHTWNNGSFLTCQQCDKTCDAGFGSDGVCLSHNIECLPCEEGFFNDGTSFSCSACNSSCLAGQIQRGDCTPYSNIICVTVEETAQSSATVAIAVSTSASLAFLALLSALVLIVVRRRYRRLAKQLQSQDHKLDIIPYADLTIHQEIGSGVSAVVWKAIWQGTEVAYKKYRSQDAAATDYWNEADSLSRAGIHPRTVLCLGKVMDAGELGILMSFMPFGSVQQRLIDDQAFPIDFSIRLKRRVDNLLVLVQMVVDASAGVLHCHHKLLLHRDIAARNFLVDSFHRVTIADFGLALSIQSETEVVSRASIMELIPVAWCAPETLLRKEYSTQSDVYSFGVFLWEVISRQAPFEEMELNTMAKSVCNEENPLTLPIPNYCPQEMADLIIACTQWHSEQRPSMDSVNQDLFAYLTALKKSPDAYRTVGVDDGQKRAERHFQRAMQADHKEMQHYMAYDLIQPQQPYSDVDTKGNLLPHTQARSENTVSPGEREGEGEEEGEDDSKQQQQRPSSRSPSPPKPSQPKKPTGKKATVPPPSPPPTRGGRSAEPKLQPPPPPTSNNNNNRFPPKPKGGNGAKRGGGGVELSSPQQQTVVGGATRAGRGISVAGGGGGALCLACYSAPIATQCGVCDMRVCWDCEAVHRNQLHMLDNQDLRIVDEGVPRKQSERPRKFFAFS